MRTWLTERFGITAPVVVAPMAGVSGGALAAAVSTAGGLGMIGFASGELDDLRQEVAVAASTGRPFGVGFLAWTFEPGDEAFIDVALEGGASLISMSYGDYAPQVERVHAAGAVFATQAGTVTDANQAVDAGVDVVVARGSEGGGHGPGEVATLPLLQAVLDEVDVPVLAAGGIATARGVAAVLAAGAAGAWCGTAFVACLESAYPEWMRERVVAAAETDTMYSRVFDIGRGVPWPERFGGRALRTPFAEEWHGRERDLEAAGHRFDERVVWAGEAAGLVRAQRPAAEVIAELAGAERLLADIGARIG